MNIPSSGIDDIMKHLHQVYMNSTWNKQSVDGWTTISDIDINKRDLKARYTEHDVPSPMKILD